MTDTPFRILRRALVSGSAASIVSLAALLARGERECRSAFAPVNAVSHWIWASRALRQQEGSLRYTLPGYVIHHGASVLWATLYEAGVDRRRPRGDVGHVGLGLAVAAIACFVDLRLTPERLTPGFERRLGPRSLALVYAAFGLGLALPALLRIGRPGAERFAPTDFQHASSMGMTIAPRPSAGSVSSRQAAGASARPERGITTMGHIAEVAAFMKKRELMLVTAESCTAGLIAARLADIPGAGALLDCAFVTYSCDAKENCLGVRRETIDRYNLTSEEVAREMAEGALQRSRANLAIANTGITDPVDNDIPPGTQCFAWIFRHAVPDGKTKVFTETRRFTGSRNAIRNAASEYALRRIPFLYDQLHKTE